MQEKHSDKVSGQESEDKTVKKGFVKKISLNSNTGNEFDKGMGPKVKEESDFEWDTESVSPTPSPINKKFVDVILPQGSGFMDPLLFASISPTSILSETMTPIHPSESSQLSAITMSMWSPSPFKNIFSPCNTSTNIENLKDAPLSPFSSFAGSLSPLSEQNDTAGLPSGEVWMNSSLSKMPASAVDIDSIEDKSWNSKLNLPSPVKLGLDKMTEITIKSDPEFEKSMRSKKPNPKPVSVFDVNSKAHGVDGSMMKRTRANSPEMRSHLYNGQYFSHHQHPIRYPQGRLPLRPGLGLVNNMYGSLPLSSQPENMMVPSNMDSSGFSQEPHSMGKLNTMLHDGKKGVCNCKKSKCLKLYCECFAAGKYCTSCNCIDCMNTTATEVQRQEAIKNILERNPKAFSSKINRDASHKEHHSTGCNCKKSSCLKKYCECYQAGVPCYSRCKCVQCLNGLQGTSPAHPMPPPGGIPSLLKDRSSKHTQHPMSGGRMDRRMGTKISKDMHHPIKSDPSALLPNFMMAMSQCLSPAPISSVGSVGVPGTRGDSLTMSTAPGSGTGPQFLNSSSMLPRSTQPHVRKPVSDHHQPPMTSLLASRHDGAKQRTPPRPLNQLQVQLDRHLKKRQRLEDSSSSSDSIPPPTSAPKDKHHRVASPIPRYSEKMEDGKLALYSGGRHLEKDIEQRISPQDKEPIQKDHPPPTSLPVKKMMLMQKQALTDTTTDKKPSLVNLPTKMIGASI